MTMEWIGMIAAVFTTTAMVPQALKIIRTKDTRSISLVMYLTSTLGVFLWIIYGFMKKDIPLFTANVLTFIPAAIILILKLKYGAKEKKEKS